MATRGLSSNEAKIASMGSLLSVETANAIDNVSASFLAGIRSIFSLGVTDFEKRETVTIFVDGISTFWLPLTLIKLSSELLGVSNSLLLLTLGSVVPFAIALRKVFIVLPCPKIAEIVSNSTLVGILVVLIIFSKSSFGNIWQTVVFCLMIWVWLVLASMLARLHVSRKDSHLSPIFHFPLIGISGALSAVSMVYALKSISLTDCLAISVLDPVISGVAGIIFFGDFRKKLHAKFLRILSFLILSVVVYFLDAQSVSAGHLLFALGRLILAFRSIWLKKSFFNESKAVALDDPIETRLFPVLPTPPRRHAFSGFPAPILSRLDSIFLSGLTDTDIHSIGPKGTEDLLILTDCTYLLPIASLSCWLLEQSTSLATGLSVQVPGRWNGLIWLFLGLIVMSLAVQPWAVSRKLFDRGSCPKKWAVRPVLLCIPFFIVDLLYMNFAISRLQLVVASVGLVCLGIYREGISDVFHRRKVLAAASALYFYQPSTLRAPQRACVSEFVQMQSTSVVEDLLMETAIYHGNNIKELVKQVRGEVWDPRPSATAAWKLAVSLVSKSLTYRKAQKLKENDHRILLVDGLRNIVDDVISRAVEAASGDGVLLARASHVSEISSKKSVFKKMTQILNKSKSPVKRNDGGIIGLAFSGGALRSVAELSAELPGTIPTSPKRQFVPSLPSPLSVLLTLGSSNFQLESDEPAVSVVEQLRGLDIVSVSAGGSVAFAIRSNGEVFAWGSNKALEAGFRDDVTFAEVPNLVKLIRNYEITNIASTQASIAQSYSLALVGSGQVLSFGTSHDGALGLDETRTIPQIIRFTNSLKIKAIACGLRHSLLLDVHGSVWAFGDNQDRQLASSTLMRTSDPTIIEGLINVKMIASGDSHCLAVDATDQVWTWGLNSGGQLGLGSYESKSVPVRIQRLSNETDIVSIACGSQHSVIVSKSGRKVWTWGNGISGQLGLSSSVSRALADESSKSVPTVVASLSLTRKIVQVSAAGNHTMLLDEGGEVLVSGDNTYGQLGLIRQANVNEFVVVPALKLYHARYISTAETQSLCLATSGSN